MSEAFPASREAIAHRRTDPHALGHGHASAGPPAGMGHGETGPAATRITVGYGFWIFLLSDIVLFSAFFAAYAVLKDATAGGPGGAQLFDVARVEWETAFLLASSFTCGLSFVAANAKSTLWTEVFLAATGVLGACFLVLEASEFIALAARGDTPQRSAFLSAFFTLVGCHGLHVTAGLLWLGTMMAQVLAKGFRQTTIHRLICFNLFWHALDIIWVGIFSIVYLVGGAQ